MAKRKHPSRGLNEEELVDEAESKRESVKERDRGEARKSGKDRERKSLAGKGQGRGLDGELNEEPEPESDEGSPEEEGKQVAKKSMKARILEVVLFPFIVLIVGVGLLLVSNTDPALMELIIILVICIYFSIFFYLQERRRVQGKDEEEEEKQDLKTTIKQTLRDVAIAGIIVLLIFAGLYAYSGVWPPPVVIESQSMSHGPGPPTLVPSSKVGVIDGGDMVIVKKVNERNDIVTYVEANPEIKTKDNSRKGYMTYGGFGDVIIYRKGGSVTSVPVIHRAILWIEFNGTKYNKTTGGGAAYDIPNVGPHGLYAQTDKVTISVPDYSKSETVGAMNVTIDLAEILREFHENMEMPHSGFITMGDHNVPSYDQEFMPMGPVKVEWVVGKAVGELPWIGIIKLWVGNQLERVPQNSFHLFFLAITDIVLIFIVLGYAYDYAVNHLKSPRKKAEGEKREEGSIKEDKEEKRKRKGKGRS